MTDTDCGTKACLPSSSFRRSLDVLIVNTVGYILSGDPADRYASHVSHPQLCISVYRGRPALGRVSDLYEVPASVKNRLQGTETPIVVLLMRQKLLRQRKH